MMKARLFSGACKRLHNQLGSTAIEMAIVFPLLFGVTYAAVVYGYVFYIEQTLNLFAQEAVRNVARVDPAIPGFAAAVDGAARTSVTTSKNAFALSIPSDVTSAITASTTSGTDSLGAPTLTVLVSLPTSTLASHGFATVNLPFGLMSFPPLPATLMATAVVNLN